MKLEKYVRDLLLEYETVIIPGFGAFISGYKPAEISEKEIKPPSRQISFSSNIRNNDGLLVDYVANAEQVSHFDALKIIEKDRDNIIFQLDKGEKVTLEEIGELYSNEKNEIQFTPFQEENLQAESFGLEAVSLEKLAEQQPEPEINEENQPDEQPVVEEETEIIPVENGEEEVTDEESEPIEDEIVQETDETPEEEINEVSEAVSDSATEETELIPEQVEATNETPKSEEEKKKKAGWYWYLLILIPVIVAGVFVVKNVSEEKPEYTNPKTVIQAPPKNESQAEEATGYCS